MRYLIKSAMSRLPAHGRVDSAFVLLPAVALALCWSSDPSLVLGQAPDRSQSPPPAGTVQEPPTSEQVLNFETPEMAGTIRLDGAYHGVTRLLDKRTGRQVIDPRYSALNLFKLMSVNHVMGQPRNMERTVRFGPDWAEVCWPATDTHRGEVVARYEVHPPNAVDLTVTVRSRGTYRAYETFLSSYFDKALQPHVALKSRDGKSSDWVLPLVNDVFRGTVLVFPRDMPSARHCLDGRWDRSEGGVPVVQMCPVRCYAHCLAILVDRETNLAVLLMSRPSDCYAISTRYHAEDDADRLTSYSAFDFSLFGGDFVPGIERSSAVRLAITSLDQEFSKPLRLYEEFLAEKSASLPP